MNCYFFELKGYIVISANFYKSFLFHAKKYNFRLFHVQKLPFITFVFCKKKLQIVFFVHKSNELFFL